MASQDFNDLTFPEKEHQLFSSSKTPEEITTLYNEWAKGYEDVRGITETLLSIRYMNIIFLNQIDMCTIR